MHQYQGPPPACGARHRVLPNARPEHDVRSKTGVSLMTTRPLYLGRAFGVAAGLAVPRWPRAQDFASRSIDHRPLPGRWQRRRPRPDGRAAHEPASGPACRPGVNSPQVIDRQGSDGCPVDSKVRQYAALPCSIENNSIAALRCLSPFAWELHKELLRSGGLSLLLRRLWPWDTACDESDARYRVGQVLDLHGEPPR
jgi:hypothetical protein